MSANDRKCDLCTCTNYKKADGSGSIWLCGYHITVNTDKVSGNTPAPPSTTTKCIYCTTDGYLCPVGHTVYLCKMRHAKHNPYCPLNQDDGLLK